MAAIAHTRERESLCLATLLELELAGGLDGQLLGDRRPRCIRADAVGQVKLGGFCSLRKPRVVVARDGSCSSIINWPASRKATNRLISGNWAATRSDRVWLRFRDGCAIIIIVNYGCRKRRRNQCLALGIRREIGVLFTGTRWQVKIWLLWWLFETPSTVGFKIGSKGKFRCSSFLLICKITVAQSLFLNIDLPIYLRHSVDHLFCFQFVNVLSVSKVCTNVF